MICVRCDDAQKGLKEYSNLIKETACFEDYIPKYMESSSAPFKCGWCTLPPRFVIALHFTQI